MNLDPQTPNGARNRSIVKILAGLLAAGVVIGLLTGLLSAGAMRALGFRPDATQTPADAPATPKSSPTTAETSEPTETPTSTPTADDTDTKKKDKKKQDKDKKHRPRLDASPAQVSAGERINLSGVFPGLETGVVLQVQRREDGSWQDFPVVARTDADGTFETWVISGRTGKTKFRMKAEGSGRKTPPATVLIG